MSFDEPLNIDYDGNELLLSDVLGTEDDTVIREFEKNENKRELLKAMEGLKERERMIVQMRYGIDHEELTQKDIAKNLGISQSYISRLEKRILQKLKVVMKATAEADIRFFLSRVFRFPITYRGALTASENRRTARGQTASTDIGGVST